MSAVLPSATSASVPRPAAGSAPPGTSGAATRSTDDDRRDSGDSVVSAIERLTLSRARLRDAMMPRRRVRASRPALADGVGAYASGLVERLRASPGTAVILEAIEAWWATHPLRTAAVMAAEATSRLAAPIAQRRPLTLVFGAVFVGALLALLRPWRWLLRPAVFAGLVPAILLRVFRELPVDSWLHAATAFAPPRAKGPGQSEAGTPLATGGDVAATARPTANASDIQTRRAEPSTVYP